MLTPHVAAEQAGRAAHDAAQARGASEAEAIRAGSDAEDAARWEMSRGASPEQVFPGYIAAREITFRELPRWMRVWVAGRHYWLEGIYELHPPLGTGLNKWRERVLSR
jgi:hypothetical protein